MKEVYPDFIKTLDKGDYIFASVLDTVSSAKAFLEGLFQEKAISVDTSTKVYDQLAVCNHSKLYLYFYMIKINKGN